MRDYSKYYQVYPKFPDISRENTEQKAEDVSVQVVQNFQYVAMNKDNLPIKLTHSNLFVNEDNDWDW